MLSLELATCITIDYSLISSRSNFELLKESSLNNLMIIIDLSPMSSRKSDGAEEYVTFVTSRYVDFKIFAAFIYRYQYVSRLII